MHCSRKWRVCWPLETMGEAKRKRNANDAAAVCEFCGGLGMSHEHLWSKWMHPLFPRGMDENSHIQFTTHTRQVGPDAMAIRPDIQSKRGHGLARTLRKFCERCNNGWMSQVDQRAAAPLAELITGAKSRLDEEDCRSVAAWIAMKAIVGEYTHPESAAIPAADRHHVMTAISAPPHWRIYVGRIAPPAEGLQAGYQHYRLNVGIRFEETLIIPTNVQVTTFTLGHVVVVATSVSEPQLERVLERVSLNNMRALWPLPQTEIDLSDLPAMSPDEGAGMWTAVFTSMGVRLDPNFPIAR